MASTLHIPAQFIYDLLQFINTAFVLSLVYILTERERYTSHAIKVLNTSPTKRFQSSALS